MVVDEARETILIGEQVIVMYPPEEDGDLDGFLNLLTQVVVRLACENIGQAALDNC